MVIIWGSQLYGKTDEIQGIGHVATRFGHLYYIPLIPMGSMFITGQEGEHYLGAPISLSARSVLLAWARAVSILATIGSLIFLVTATPDMGPVGGKLVPAVLLAFSIMMIVLFRMGWAMKASYERAKELSNTVGFDPRLDVFIDLHYEKITEMEADQRMDALESSMEDLEDLEDEIEASGMKQQFDVS